MFPAFVRTTTFRLALIHAVLFAVFSAGLLAYLYTSTVGYLERQSTRELQAEVSALAAAYRNGGLDRLNQSVVERITSRGSFFYLLINEDGDRVSGDFSALPVEPPAGTSEDIEFEYQIEISADAVEERRAKGIIIRLPNDYVLLVAYDLGDRSKIVGRITDAVWTAAPIGLALSLLGGFFVSRSAARRAEALAETAESVMAGDLSRRAPVWGSGDEFDRLSERMNAMLEKVERLMLATRYSGDAIAHDLRSPLTRLRNRLEADLADPRARENPEETLGQTIEEVDSVLSTFNSILRLSRVEAGESGQLVLINGSELAEEVAELYGPASEDIDLDFASEIQGNLMIRADRSLLAQALTNLLDNALKYTPAGGALTFRARRNGKGDVEFSVTDTGPGIPAEERQRATERFVRLDTSRGKTGSGLGLSLVAAVAEVHNGKFELSDGPGQGEHLGLRAAITIPRGR